MIDATAPPRDITRMGDNKPNVLQITEDCARLVDGLKLDDQQQVMAALAARYKMKLVQ